MPNARKVAVDMLLKVETDSAYSNIILKSTLSQSELSSVDKAFATAIFYGVLDRKITLDYFLDSLTKTPFSKTDAFTKTVLRAALYQILFMDKVPESAAVNEAVKLMKNSKKRAQSGFVNAVLRAALRSKLTLPEDNLSVKYSCPEWIVNELIGDYGKEETEKILAEFLTPANVYLQVNNLKITAKELSDELGTENEITEEGAIKILGKFDVENSPLYKKGCFYVQDLSSYRAVKMLAPSKNERLLDICAAPGGKTFTAALLMENSGEIISCDIYKNRTELIEKGAKRLGLGIVKTHVGDAAKLNTDLGLFDAVLCDVPCSGLGVLKRKPDVKYKEITDFSELENIQSDILFNAANYVKKGGRLLYSTCTLRKKENERQVEKFLAAHPDFELIKMHTFLPHIDLTDGFFAALLIRKEQ